MSDSTRPCSFIDKNGVEKTGHGIWLYLSQLDAQLVEQIRAVQDILRRKFGEAVWLHPVDKLHMTVVVIKDAFGVHEMDPGQLRKGQIEMRNLLAKVRPFEITFDQLLINRDVVGVQATQVESLNTLREEIRATLGPVFSGYSLPAPIKPEIVHITVARHLSELPMQDIRALLTDVRVHATVVLRNLELVEVHTVPTGIDQLCSFVLAIS